jgi:hypothetical protein
MASSSATSAERQRPELADIVRISGAQFAHAYPLSTEQKRVLDSIVNCRTAALGGHQDFCPSCGHSHPAYNSCLNRHCPKCQALAQQRWIDAREKRILPTKHFHVVFTLPSELRALAAFAKKPLYNALFEAASSTLLELARTHLGAELGITAVLHTWTRDLRFHPHLHCIVTAGGLSLQNHQWISCNHKFLFPVMVLGSLFRAKMAKILNTLYACGTFDRFDDFADPQAFDRLMQKLAKINWLVYVKKPFSNSIYVLRYLGRYTHRVAISNSRIVSVSHQSVTFRTKDGKSITISPCEFLRRFVMHILPSRFVKIRHYGLLASANVHTKLETARVAIVGRSHPSVSSDAPPPPLDWSALLFMLTGRDPRRCPRCGNLLVSFPLARVYPKPSIFDSS